MANISSIAVGARELATVQWQADLFDASEFSFDRAFADLSRNDVGDGAWIDRCPAWARGCEPLLHRLLLDQSWRSNTVTMYDRIVAEPRLTNFAFHQAIERFPEVASLSAALSARYDRDLSQIGAALYRDGNDSVAWHGDRFSNGVVEPMVAIVSFGSPRTLRVRRRGGGVSTAFAQRSGDLTVLGGTIHRTHEHSVPKTRRCLGPRVSMMFREPAPNAS